MHTTIAAGRVWRFRNALGRQTVEANGEVGGFRYPIAVSVAPDGHIFTLSRGMDFPNGYTSMHGRRIGKMTIDEHHIGDFARGDFVWPTGLAVAHDGQVFCSDEYLNQVMVYDPEGIVEFPQYDPDGEYLAKWGATGAEPGQMDGPSGLAFDSNDDLYLVDSRNDRVQKFAKDGRYITGWGGSGSGDGQFNRPWGVTVDSDDNVYVADWGNDRVQKFAGDGEYLMTFGSSPEEGGDLSRPADVAVDSDGDVYVTDWGNSRVQIYDSSGDILTALHGDSTEMNRAGEYAIRRDPKLVVQYSRIEDKTPLGRFGRPVGIAVDAENRVIITDTRGRLQVYTKESAASLPANI